MPDMIDIVNKLDQETGYYSAYTLKKISSMLEKDFYKPDILGNFEDPTKELFYLILTQRTRIKDAKRIIENIDINNIYECPPIIFT
jgi:hypothetical protein